MCTLRFEQHQIDIIGNKKLSPKEVGGVTGDVVYDVVGLKQKKTAAGLLLMIRQIVM